MKRPNRKPAAKGTTKAEARKVVHRFAYALPRLFDSGTEKSGASLEMYCRSAIRAAWEAGERGRVKAAREEIARCRLAPADIAAIARSRRAALATRNTSDFDHCGLRIINPWTAVTLE